MTTSSICIRSMTVLERKYHTLTLATSIEAERLHAVPHAFQSRAMFLNVLCCCLVAKVCLILRSHGSQHTRLSCPSLSPRACSNLCPLCQWFYPTVSSCRPLLLLPSIFPSNRVFSKELALPIRWPKYCSFSFSPSNEYSGLIAFRIDWFDLLAVQETLKSLLHTWYFTCFNAILPNLPTLSRWQLRL